VQNPLLFYLSKAAGCKINRKLYEIPKTVKQILMETRFQTLPLLLMKFGLKLNTFESILNLSRRDILYVTLTYKLRLLRFLVSSIFRSGVS
jgi:hypothetical protein